MPITLTTSTDSADDVRRALGQKVEPKPDKPAAAAPAAPAEVEDTGAEAEAEEAEAEAAGAEAEAETGEAEAEPEEKKPARRRSNDAEERIGRLTWQVNNLMQKLEEERAAREQERTSREPAKPETPPAKPVFSKAAPKLEEAETIEAWMKDYAEWSTERAEFNAKLAAEEAVATRADKDEKKTEEQQRQEALARTWSEHETRLGEFRKVHEDYDEVAAAAMEQKVPLSNIALAHITNSELGPALLYHLAKHPEEAFEIAKLSDGRQIARLGRLEERLETAGEKPIVIGEGTRTTAPAASRPRPMSRQPDRAGEPIKPVGGGGGKGTKDPGSMSYREYKEWRRKGGGKR